MSGLFDRVPFPSKKEKKMVSHSRFCFVRWRGMLSGGQLQKHRSGRRRFSRKSVDVIQFNVLFYPRIEVVAVSDSQTNNSFTLSQKDRQSSYAHACFGLCMKGEWKWVTGSDGVSGKGSCVFKLKVRKGS